MAQIIRSDGSLVELKVGDDVKNSKRLKVFQDAVGGWVEVLRLRDGRLLVFDEEGKLKSKNYNAAATNLAAEVLARDDVLVGDVVVTTLKEFEGEED